IHGGTQIVVPSRCGNYALVVCVASLFCIPKQIDNALARGLGSPNPEYSARSRTAVYHRPAPGGSRQSQWRRRALRHHGRFRTGIAVVISGVVALGLAACGSSSSSSSAAGGSSTAASSSAATTTSGGSSSSTDPGVAYAKQQIAAASAIPTFKLQAPSFDMSK